jgi:hypothetical protein
MTTLTDLVEVEELGSVHDRSGRHLASFVQELLIRATRLDGRFSGADFTELGTVWFCCRATC